MWKEQKQGDIIKRELNRKTDERYSCKQGRAGEVRGLVAGPGSTDLAT